MAKKKKKGKRKVKKVSLGILFLVILALSAIIYLFLNMHIKNIYIKNNYYLSDLEIMKIANIDSYPTILNANILSIKNKLEKNRFIRKASVSKKGLFNEIYITIYENYPLFVYHGSTYLYDLKKIDESFSVPVVTNDIKEDKFDEFVECLRNVSLDTLDRISEIKYEPNEVDDERFYLTMNDGIYVYVTLNKFSRIDDYAEIVSTLNDKKGVLYLDSGEYFEVFKN